MTLRLFTALLVSAGLAIAVVLAHSAYNENKYNISRVSTLQVEKRERLSVQRSMTDQTLESRAANELLERAIKAGLGPEHWLINPLDVSSDMTWMELRSLLNLLSNADPKRTGYWFKPELFTLERIVPKDKGKAKAKAVAETEEKTKTEPEEEKFKIAVKGQFLIPR